MSYFLIEKVVENIAKEKNWSVGNSRWYQRDGRRGGSADQEQKAAEDDSEDQLSLGSRGPWVKYSFWFVSPHDLRQSAIVESGLILET